ncbi:MAG TPA: hypothetical protein DCS93_01300 [Microscillaceae bacterium]|nr:hypothetical protein [Microscillaceae bacterium]
MNQGYNHITLASGQVLSKGQIIRLGNKIAQMFPDLKGNILPLKDYSFCRADEFDFQYVQFQLEGEEFGMASKVVSLAEDEIEYFTLENATLYGYTTCFKIDMERALGTKEITVIDKEETNAASSARALNIVSLIQEIEDDINTYAMGLITEDGLENMLSYALIRLFHRRTAWEAKNAHWGFIGGTASNFMRED